MSANWNYLEHSIKIFQGCRGMLFFDEAFGQYFRMSSEIRRFGTRRHPVARRIAVSTNLLCRMDVLIWPFGCIHERRRLINVSSKKSAMQCFPVGCVNFFMNCFLVPMERRATPHRLSLHGMQRLGQEIPAMSMTCARSWRDRGCRILTARIRMICVEFECCPQIVCEVKALYRCTFFRECLMGRPKTGVCRGND